MHKIKGPCFDYQLRRCKGACIGQETAEEYNVRVQEAINSFSFSKENFVIVGRGRSRGEKSVVCVEGGKYKGFGYFQENEQELSLQDMRNYIKPYAHNRDIQKIICGYLKANVSDKQIRYQLNQQSTEMSC